MDASTSGRTPNSFPMRTIAANTRLIEAAKDASESSAATVRRRLLTALDRGRATFVFMLPQSIQELRSRTKNGVRYTTTANTWAPVKIGALSRTLPRIYADSHG